MLGQHVMSSHLIVFLIKVIVIMHMYILFVWQRLPGGSFKSVARRRSSRWPSVARRRCSRRRPVGHPPGGHPPVGHPPGGHAPLLIQRGDWSNHLIVFLVKVIVIVIVISYYFISAASATATGSV